MTEVPDNVYLETAAFLGRRLCRDALWAGPRCNWLGDSMEFVDNAWSVVHRVLGPDLYAGTSGIAIFLARLHRLTGERLFQVAAEGAIAHALSCLQDIPPPARMAFYSGWTGVAYAAAELAELFDSAALLDRAFALIGEAARDSADNPGLDVIGGGAGAIPALISLHRRYARHDILPLAVRLGEHLLANARQSDVGASMGWSWNTLDGQTERDPTGFSHGAAGIAWALLELYAETRTTSFRTAAERGFAYEGQWFSKEHENWPDFRKIANPASGGGTPNYAVAWCHGAPGIGLSRLRAYEILGTDDLKREAQAAVRTTSSMLSHPGYGVQYDFTLCHGRSGNAELLIYAGEALGDGASRAGAEAIGRQGIEYFRRNDLPWPCGVPGGGETPGLMLGLAGIGYFYLRLYQPGLVPSVLIIRPRIDHSAAALARAITSGGEA
jgi:type 2 lantibiotic biosynthesis protein LanM